MVSQLKVNEIIKQSGSTLTIGQDGDTVLGPFTNTPYFLVSLSSSQTSISNGVDTKVAFNNVIHDEDSLWDSTNYRFIPTKAGKYYVFTNVYSLGPSDTTVKTSLIRLYKNGSQIARHIWYNGSGWVRYTSCNLSYIVDMNGSTDYLEVFAQQDTTGASWEIHGANPPPTWFGAYRMIGA